MSELANTFRIIDTNASGLQSAKAPNIETTLYEGEVFGFNTKLVRFIFKITYKRSVNNSLYIAEHNTLAL